MTGLLQGDIPKFGPKVTHPSPVDLSVGVLETYRYSIANYCRMVRLHTAQRSQWRAYRKPPSLFRMVPSLTPYDLPFPPKWGFHMPPTYANGHISATGDPIHFRFVLGYKGKFFGDGGSNSAIYGSNKSKMAATAMLEKFQVAISPQPVVRSTSCFVLGWGFRGWRI